MCRMCRCTLSSWKYWSCRKLLHQMQKRLSEHSEEENLQKPNTATVTEINSQRERLTGGVLKSTQTTARKLHFLKRLPWTSGVWCAHLNRIITGHKLFFFFDWKQKRKIKIKNQNFVIIRSAELSGQRSCFQDSIFVAQWAEIILHFGAKPC